jgi:hypothetical protein
MLVKLKNNWFDPSGTYRKASRSPHSVPDSWKDKLPASAEILKEPKAPAPLVKEALEKMKGDELRKLAAERNVSYDPADTNAVIIEKLLK